MDMENGANEMQMMDLGDVKISNPCDKLMAALSKMQGELKMATKDNNNPYFKSKYADLATCITTAKKPMADNGLAVSQHCGFDGNCVKCVTVLGHSSGQYMASTCVIPVTKKDAQGVGSAITYARRYSFSAVIGLSQEDDDGNGASNKDVAKKQKQEQEKQKAMAENQKRLDDEENYRIITEDNIEVKMKNGQWLNLDNMQLAWLELLLKDERFASIHEFVQKKIAFYKSNGNVGA